MADAPTLPDEPASGAEPRKERLMAVPEPRDKAFVERVQHEIDEARRRVKELFGSGDTASEESLDKG